MSSNSQPILWIVGSPLDDAQDLEAGSIELLSQMDLVVGERRKTTFRWLRQLQSPEVHLLDPPRKDTWELLDKRLTELADTGGQVALLSDGGMPILWDPGAQVLNRCRQLGYAIRCRPSATSWGTACAISGFSPPFFLVGFPPQKKPERRSFFQSLANQTAHCVLMDTPYRFELLLQETASAFGPQRLAFLAWEISKPEEQLAWQELGHFVEMAGKQEARKGEFILIVEGKGMKP